MAPLLGPATQTYRLQGGKQKEARSVCSERGTNNSHSLSVTNRCSTLVQLYRSSAMPSSVAVSYCTNPSRQSENVCRIRNRPMGPCRTAAGTRLYNTQRLLLAISLSTCCARHVLIIKGQRAAEQRVQHHPTGPGQQPHGPCPMSTRAQADGHCRAKCKLLQTSSKPSPRSLQQNFKLCCRWEAKQICCWLLASNSFLQLDRSRSSGWSKLLSWVCRTCSRNAYVLSRSQERHPLPAGCCWSALLG